jgi:subtilisin family serine protease
VLATFLCAAPLLAAPAHAAGDLPDRIALREVLRQKARASSARVLPLPLPDAPGALASEAPRASAASTSRDVASIARSGGPVRVLVGARTHGDVPGLAAALRRLGAQVEVFETIGVVAAAVPSGATTVARLQDDPRVAYIERDRELRIATDPFDVIDPATGVKFTWAYDGVRAGEALVAAGGGSQRTIAVIDTGLDLTHPEFTGRVAGTFDTSSGGTDVTDFVGHGTFVTGLIAAVDGNGIGGKGVAGNTRVIAVRASTDGGFTVGDLIRGIQFSVRRGADVLNLSLAGGTFSRSQARVLDAAFINDVLPVAASGNSGDQGNPLEFPAAAVGGRRGGRGIGLSVSATKPDGSFGVFSTHNEFVSVAAPGAGPSGCEFGVFSTLPPTASDWDDPKLSCSRIFVHGSARYAYGEGTSFAAPIAAGMAALAWHVEPRLASEQVADVMVRSAHQTIGTGWNEFTGAGVVDGFAAAALARTYDVSAPRVHAKARRSASRVAVRIRGSKDRTESGRELAGRVTYGLLVSRDGGRNFSAIVRQRRRPFRRTLRIRGARANILVATVCDRNGNCDVKRLGRFTARSR